MSRTPEIHLLSNGRYHVAISNAGGGYSRWKDLAITRWREDATCDYWGAFIYLRDVTTGEFWSAAYQPTLRATKNYEAIFTQARAEFRQRHGNLELHTELSVSPEDDVELRRLTLTNHSSTARTIELTSYAEVVLATQAADELHPTFSNLFVQTEFVPDSSAILCTRRARTAEEKPPWLLHLLVGQGGTHGETSCETDRARFVGRNGNLANPAAMQKVAPLSNTAGSVLDPIISLRRTVTLQPDEIAVLDFVIGAAENRETANALVEKYQHFRMADRALRSGLDPQPGDPAPAQRHRSRSATLRPAGWGDHLCRSRPPRDLGHSAGESPRPKRALGLRHFRRHAARSAARHRPGEHRTRAPAY